MTIVGSQTGANASLRQALPGTNAHQRDRVGARHRPSGRHRRPGARRLSLVVGLPPREIFLSACGFALIAAICAALLAFRGERLIDEAGATADMR